MNRPSFLTIFAAVAFSHGATSASAAQGKSTPPARATATILSSRADMVSDGSALIRVDNPSVSNQSETRIRLGDRDVTRQFKIAADGSLQGVVSGLPLGPNVIVVSVNGAAVTRLVLVNHDRNGPIISGPHQKPWICQTSDFRLPDGSILGPSQDANCNAQTKVTYLYMPSTGATFKVMRSPFIIPEDVRKTTTSDGRVVNYIVRVETGTLDRGIYQFAVLYDPTKEVALGPLSTYEGWNRRIVYTFGGSLSAGYLQGSSSGGVINDLMLSQGFAVVSSSLNVFGNTADDVLSAESASMTIEKFTKEFGVPVYVMGWGSSGGSMQQYLIANNYPGLLDGITPGMAFADLHSILPAGMDCAILTRAFAKTSEPWTDAQKTAVTGYKDYRTCAGFPTEPPIAWNLTYAPMSIMAKQVPVSAMGVDISNCHLKVPRSLTYDPVANRKGARCDIYDNVINQMGIDASTGYAARAVDNVGVQYGLKALKKGIISPEQFVELNELIGGYDSDGNFQAARSVASPIALSTSYAFGRINEGKNLGKIPIIDYRNYLDPDAHNAVRSISIRVRLTRANGSAANQVILRAAPGTAALPGIVLKAMDLWLSNISMDKRVYASQADKVIANRPADLQDACYTAAGLKIVERADIGNSGRCGALYPYFSGPRMVSGGPMTDDVLKCRLISMRRSDYPAMMASQFGRLQKVFAAGVCDYSKPSVGAQPLRSAWLAYTAPGNAHALRPTP